MLKAPSYQKDKNISYLDDNTHTFDNISHRAGVPRLERGSNHGEPTRSLWPHDVVVWVRSSAQGSVRQRRIPQGSTTKRGEVDPKA